MLNEMNEFDPGNTEPIDQFFPDTQLLMYSTDRNGIVTRVTPPWAARLGRDPDEMIGQSLETFLEPGSQGCACAPNIIATQASGTALNTTLDFLCADGTRVPVMTSSIPHFSDDGRLHRILVLVVDTSDAERTRGDLAQRARIEVIGNIVGGVAHEFNNLLSVVMGNLELLADLPDHPDRGDMLADAIAATRRGATLTQQLVAYGGRSQLNPRAHDLNALLSRAHTTLTQRLPDTIAMILDAPQDLPRVMIDGAQFQGVFSSIVDNARDAMPNGGTITLTARILSGPASHPDRRTPDKDTSDPDAPRVAITVRDDGTGMTPDVRERAFDPFFSTRGIGRASGMGLSTVSGFVRQSGGTVELDSAPGQGTRLTMVLPTLAPALSAAPTSRAAPNFRPGGHTIQVPGGRNALRVLVVEDKEEVRRFLARQLRAEGHDVIEASSGDSAMSLIEHGLCPQMILTDMAMPGHIQGGDLIARVRDRMPDVKTVLISGHAPELLAASSAPANDDVRLSKPVSRAALLDCLARLGADAPATDQDAAKGVAARLAGF